MPKSNQKSKKISRNIYMDYASSALFSSPNPSAIHAFGMKEKLRLENARKKVADILKAHSDEIIFTSGATEGNNLAILGLVYAKQKQSFLNRSGMSKAQPLIPKLSPALHIVTTNIEHASVLETCRYLEKTRQATVTYVPAEENGIVDPKKIKKSLKKNTVLVSVMYANNEIGTIQPIKEIAKEIRHFKKTITSNLEHKTYPIFHTDATQAINYLPIQMPQLGVDMMSFNAAKIYGPKGVGALYVKKLTPITKIIFGGDQERGLRAGTENVEGAVALAAALDIAEKMKEKEVKRLAKLRDYFLNKISKIAPDIKINGDLRNRLPNNINITIPNIPSDLLVIELSTKGIMASAKSACKSGDGKASHVISAIDPSIQETDGSIRFSLGRETTKTEIDHVIKALSEILLKLKRWYN
ncbi:MAG TPA: cysteine desulfurase family protein [Candidatus Paceibacterota bacterium]|jgi:cysteine desulfurase|nr:cysteine desulfurase family protein [Candidatus Paceibacterota bacterium]